MVATSAAAGQRPASGPGVLQARLDTLGWLLFAGALCACMLLSAPALLLLGIRYDVPGGPPFAKLHPGSALMVLALACLLLRHGNPLAVLWLAFRRQVLVSIYFLSMVLVFVWVVYRHGSSGAAYIVDTLCMPGVALLCLDLLPPARRRQALRLVIRLLCANAVLALAEYALHVNLMPVPINAMGVQYFRSTAFLGHPLNNANVTMALLPAVLLMPWRPWLQVAAGVVLAGSVLAFGARTALLVGLAVYGGHAAVHATLQALRGRYSYRQLTGGAAAVLAGSAALVLAVMATGLGERIFRNLRWDSSANVRMRVWDAFDHVRGAEWWLGMPPVDIDRVAVAIGLDPRFEAIENFWIYGFLQFGAIGFVPFVVGLACLIVALCRAAPPALRGTVLVFFAIASTTNSLTSKSPALTLLAVVVLASAATLRARLAQRAPASPPPAWRPAARRSRP